MICHLVFEHEYSQYYNEFICRNFDIKDHVFIVYDRSTIGYRTDFNFQNGHYLKTGDATCLEMLHEAAAIIVHGLFFESVVDLFYTHRELLDKTTWVLWGGDLYLYRQLGTEKLSETLENKRRVVISGLKWIACPVHEDYTLATSVYNSSASYICAFYSMTIDFDYLDTIRQERKPSKLVNILLGNSAEPSNNHEEMLHTLARFRDDIRIYCPLSYGRADYSEKVITLGQELFGDRFIPLTEPQPFNDYTRFLTTIDLGVMNHDRQQGLGTIAILLYLGKKVFIRSDISSHATLTKNGIALFDISDLKYRPFNTIVEYDSGTSFSNIEAIRREYSERGCCEKWRQLFSTVTFGGTMNHENTAPYFINKVKSKYFPESTFVGPYESEGKTVSVWEEQWLWSNREFIRGTVLDMSTPRYWHEFIHQLDAVDKVLISNLDNEPVSKFGQSSMPDVVGDICKPGIVPDCSFDTILCLSILEHCEDMFGMFKNLFDMVKPGGHVFFYTPYAYTDGHLTPDYWRIGRDGYRLLAARTGFEIVQERNAGDMGKYLMEDYGIDASATDWHRGIPNAVTVICRRPELPAGKTYDKTGKKFPASAMTRLYAGDIPDLPEYDGWTGLSITTSDHRHILHDITQPLPFPDNSVDAFQAEDVMEHIPYEKLPPVFDEIYRVLKPGALFRLSVPDYGCDVLRERSVKDAHDNIVFDPGGGGTPEDPGHLWFPRIESVYRLLEKTRFFSNGSINFLHYWNMTGTSFVADPIDYSKGMIKRTPDNDARVMKPYRPMSLVADLYKSEETGTNASKAPAVPWRRDGNILAYPHGWQTPAITEQYAYEQVFKRCPLVPEAIYIAFPWATLIDLLQTGQEEKAAVYLRILENIPRLDSLRKITVAQHIYAARYIELFEFAGITDLYWVHAINGVDRVNSIRVHPFPLYPVRCLDKPHLPRKPLNARRYLYSFVGAYDHKYYLSPAREWISMLPASDMAHIQVTSEWHFNCDVYEKQIFNSSVAPEKQAKVNLAAEEYRHLLAETVFSLCPSGSGPNSIRLWESLGFGCIPVIISDTLRLPGDLNEWQQAAIFIPEDEHAIAALPEKLRTIAGDAKLLQRYIEAGKRLWEKYGHQNFIHDIEQCTKFATKACTSQKLPAGEPSITLASFADFTYAKKHHFDWFKKYATELFQEKINPDFCDLKVYQDLLVFTFIRDNIPTGAKILDIGGGNSRILSYFKNEYECWNLDKLEGAGNGPLEINHEGYRLVRDYIGNFSDELPEEYFDFVFSISSLEHVPYGESKHRELHKNICLDIDRVLKPGGISLHCFDISLSTIKDCWTNDLAPFMANCFSQGSPRASLKDAASDPDIFTMSEQYFNTHWKKHPAVNWEFAEGKPSSWNVIWQKALNPRLEDSAVSWDAIRRYRTTNDPRWPKLSVVTPSFNQVGFLEECIQSVLSQHYPNLEYIVMDGGSNDGSEYIIQRYSQALSYWQSQPDNGQYSAIHDGFLRSSGQIMTWINSDDRFHPGAFEKVAAIFSERPDIEWITCRPNSIDEQGNQLEVRADLPQWSQEKYLRKQYKDPYIQQEGTFWRRTLWDKAGGGLRLDLKLAGDLELWARFFRYAKLHTTGDLLAAFRVHPDQKTASFLQQYWLEAESVLDREIELHSRANGAGQQPAAGQNRYDFLVSAIVSTYKSEKFIQGCLEDLTAQTLFRSGRLEIVIVNSASPQDEERIIQPYLLKFPRQIKYIRTDTRETIYKAWNRGIEASSGKYLTNANTDDRHRCDALELMANELETNPGHVLVYTDQLYTTVPNDTFEATATTKLRVWAEYSYETLRSHCMVSSQPMWRRSMHDLYGYFDDSYTSAGDWEFWLRIGKKESFKKIRKVLGLYFENPEGVENSNPLSEPEAMKVRQTYGIAPNEQRYSAFAVYHRARYSAGDPEDTPRVSVILPCYNYGQYLKHAVGSVLTQTYQDFEIIIINDGSTDNSREVAEQCVAQFPQYRIRVINQENSGHPAHSRNRGVRAALGDYILPLDADDMIAPTMLEECVGLLDRRPDISIAYTDQIYFNEKEQGISNQPEYDLSQLIHKNQFAYCSLYRRKAWEDAGGYRVIGYEDWDFWITCGERGHHAMRIAKPLFYYRKKESGVYAEDLKRDRELRARIVMNHTALYPQQSVEDAMALLREIDGADSIAAAGDQDGISFCIITGGKRPEMLELAVRSIRAQQIPVYEIIVIGRHHHSPGITYLPAEEAAGQGRLGAMRNLGVARARYGTIAIMDDDIILSTDWHREFARYGVSFDILTSQVRVPDGSRYWDHCTHGGPRGHLLLEGNETDDHLYMTGGGGWVMSSRVAKTIRWDDDRGFYKEEDTTFSSLCRAHGFSIQHNHRMIVYHADGVYTGIGRWVARRSDGRTQEWVEPALVNRTETAILNLANEFLERQQYAETADCIRMGLLIYRNSDLLKSAWREISGNWGGDLSDSRWYPQGDPAFLNTIALLKVTQFADGTGTSSRQDAPATALTVVPPGERLSIVWEGPQFMWHSMAHVNRELCLKLIEMGHYMSLIPSGTASFGPETVPHFAPLRAHEYKQLPGEPDVTIRHWYPPNFTPPAAGHWVMMQPWEMGSVPKQWIDSMKDTVDELWVYTSYVRDCYIRSGFPADRVFVAPIGIDTDLFTPAASPMPLQTRKKWKFLYVGGTTLDRKGFDILINSYLREFTSKDDVTLVVKDLAIYTGGNNPIAQQLRELQSRPGAPEILVIEEDLTPDRLAGLYVACDCLVHSYRGEGFSLPIAEAMAMELPVIVTGHGACLDFCGNDNAYLIPAREVTVPTKQVYGLETVDNPWWAEPDADELRRLMRSAVNDPATGKRKGKVGRARILAGFTWEHAARAMQTRLQELRKKPIRRFAPQQQLPTAVIPAGSMKNILMVAPILPTFDRDSGSFRLFQIITLLRQQGHHITFIARGGAGGSDPVPYQKALADLGVKSYALDPDKLRELGLTVDAPRVDLQRILGERRYDLAYIYFHHIAYQYMDEIRSISPATRIIVDSVDLHFLREQREAELTGSSRDLLKAQQTKQVELGIYAKADMVIAVTEADKQELLAHAPNVSAEVIPNIHPLLPDAPPYDARRDILFVGGFPHTPNVDAVLYFCAEVWPLLQNRLPQARLFLVGNAPPDTVQALANDRIIVTGYVPETLPYLQQCRVSIAPLRYGAGMKGKVGEALAAGIPVVATSIAAEGTGMVPGRDILVADDPIAFADAVISVYSQKSEWNRLAGNGREFMTRNYSPEALASTLPRIIARAAGDSDHAFRSSIATEIKPTSRQVRELLRPYGATYFNESQ